MNGNNPHTRQSLEAIPRYFNGRKSFISSGKADEITIVYEIQHPRSMLKDYTMCKEYADNKQSNGYIINILEFRGRQ